MLDDQICRICERLSIAYANYVDSKRYDEFCNLFSETGILDLGNGIRFEGREKIRRSFQKRSPDLLSRHVLTNILIENLEGNWTGTTYLSLYRHQGDGSEKQGPRSITGPTMIGRYLDVYVNTESGWRIDSRQLVSDLVIEAK